MFKVVMRSNKLPFLLTVALGIAAAIYLPGFISDMPGEAPAAALLCGEIAVGLILSVLVFESASTTELIRICFFFVAVLLCSGAISSLADGGQSWVLLPDSTLKLQWIRLLALNITAAVGVLSIFETVTESILAERLAEKEAKANKSGKKLNFSPEEHLEAEALERNAAAEISETPVKPAKEDDHTVESLFTTQSNIEQPASDVENLFDFMVSKEAQKNSAATQAASAAKTEPTQPSSPAGGGGLLNVSDGEMGSLFDDLLAGDSVEKASSDKATESFGPQINDAGKNAQAAVKEFGKLSANAVVKTELSSAGTLKTIGQMLLDASAVDRIIRRAEAQETGTAWKVLTIDRGANLQALMDSIASFEGVESALLMGKDGLLLSNTESVATMKYVLGPLSLAIQSTTNLATTKLQLGELKHAILKTGDKINVLTDVGSAILAVFGQWNPTSLDRLIAHITAALSSAEAGSELTTPAEHLSLLNQPPAPADSSQKNVMNVSDGELSDIFDSLLSDDSSDKQETSAPIAEPKAAEQSGPLNVSDDEIGNIFDNLLAEPESGETAKEAKPVEEVKQFGRLSAQVAKTDTSTDGMIKGLSKQLLDVHAVENIIKSAEHREPKIGASMTTARVISASKGDGIQNLLNQIDSYDGVIGSLIVGHDGLVIASTLKGGLDKDVMGALSTAVYSHLGAAMAKLKHGKLQQSVFVGAGDKLTVMTSVTMGVLAVFADNSTVSQVDGLLSVIESTVNG